MQGVQDRGYRCVGTRILNSLRRYCSGAVQAQSGILSHAALVASSFEVGVEEGFDDFHGRIVVDKAGRQRADIRIVVFAGQLGDFGLPTDGRPDALVFVQRDRDAVRTAAQRDAPGQFAFSIALPTGWA